jgi:hypothetical protein
MAIKTFTTGEVLTASDTNTYLANSGLVFVKSQTVGVGVTAVTVSDAFSATYDAYRITIFGGSASGSNPLRFALGASNTAYYGALVYGNYATTAVGAATMNNAAYWLYTGFTNPNGQLTTIEVNNPAVANITTVSCPFMDATNAGQLTGYHGVNTAYTAFTVTPNAGTWSNSVITVYGYRKA